MGANEKVSSCGKKRDLWQDKMGAASNAENVQDRRLGKGGGRYKSPTNLDGKTTVKVYRLYRQPSWGVDGGSPEVASDQ